MSIRWTTGLGIAVGGLSGAIIALLGAANARHSAPLVPAKTSIAPDAAASVTPPEPEALAAEPMASASSAAVEAPSTAPAVAEATPSAAALGAPPVVPAATGSAAFGPSPTLEVPTTREALLRAELYCDKRQDFDECARAAAALAAGSAGPADPEQAKRFRRIALTHLVAQCESGSPHACFVIAAKYRLGVELKASPVRAEALEKRAVELCHKGRSAPECPPS